MPVLVDVDLYLVEISRACSLVVDFSDISDHRVVIRRLYVYRKLIPLFPLSPVSFSGSLVPCRSVLSVCVVA